MNETSQLRIRLGGHEMAASVAPVGDGRKDIMVDLDGQAYRFRVAGEGLRCTVQGEGGSWTIERHGARVLVDGEPLDLQVLEAAAAKGGRDHSGAAAHVRPPMTGRLESLRVKVGQAVAKGDVLFVLEAMKMLNEVRAPMAGTVAAIHVQPGSAVETHQVILDLGPSQPS